MLAADRGHTELVRTLVLAWADPKIAAPGSGLTASKLAKDKNFAAIVEILTHPERSASVAVKSGR